MPEKRKSLSLPDGRDLGYARFGARAGTPVVFMHGFPGSRLEAELFHEPAGSLGISLFAPDRPGFGLSDFQSGRAILDWPADVAALADALGIRRFHVVGGSAGCPFALACARCMPDRVAGVAIIAGLGPTSEKEVVRQMGPVARVGLALANRAPSVFKITFGALARVVARYPDLNFHLNEASPPDRAVLARPEVRAILRASVKEAFLQGSAGALQELALLAAPWGFDVEAVGTPLHVWHGQLDGVVPHAMGTALATMARGARLRLLPEEGHISLPVRHGAEILGALVSSG